ncbi:unnamed protein product [Blepharisma stoltei]|uniref:Non-haem dioxygenase N-terminal domain-containing protein n=1 Tax=Blepharisma stoltei TaxID=1481888 RepID=A0AAU9J9B0_9CILI|nr:unnamed protein product [Blepharisma stoltei]
MKIAKPILRWMSSFKPVSISYQNLLESSNIINLIEEAYGEDGLGILEIEEIPDYHSKRVNLLKFSRDLALLPQEEKQKITLPHTRAVGWSHGIESFKGEPELNKASFYANPLQDEGFLGTSLYNDNIWPDNLPQFKPIFKDFGTLIVKIATDLVKHIDLYISKKCPDYKKGTLEEVLKTHNSHIARLIHYFPQENSDKHWCDWHSDFSIVTGLTCALYLDEQSGQIIEDNEINDERTGLFIKNRRGEVMKANLTGKNLYFQVGEISQILSGGWLKPTPHCVMTTGLHYGISRNTLAVFCEPRPEFLMEVPAEHSKLFEKYEGVPALSERWKPGMTYGEFKDSSFRYYS